MRRRVWLGLAASHAAVGAVGFAGGIYVLPILTAPPPPAAAELAALQQSATFRGVFRRDLPGSDRLHWGEGEVAVGPAAVAHTGRLAPGPDGKEPDPNLARWRAVASYLGDESVHGVQRKVCAKV